MNIASHLCLLIASLLIAANAKRPPPHKHGKHGKPGQVGGSDGRCKFEWGDGIYKSFFQAQGHMANTACISYCIAKKKNDPSINGVAVEGRGSRGKCYCIRTMTGRDNSRRYRSCFIKIKVNGGYSKWTPWQRCSRSCGRGSQARRRICNSPAPQNGGAQCQGNAAESRPCNIHPCKVNGGYSMWSQWKRCSRSCGRGSQTRSRICNNPAPRYGGAQCQGNAAASRPCNTQPCKVNGGYSRWSQWKRCSRSCGRGSQARSRICNNPVPRHGGAQCKGNAAQSRPCNIHPCKVSVNGGYSTWSQWERCSRSCGSGSQVRKRSCNNPKPQYGGAQCKGKPAESRPCNIRCKVNGGYSTWSPWEPCSQTCGPGLAARRRSCDDPVPKYGGAPCIGNSVESKPCNTRPCNVKEKKCSDISIHAKSCTSWKDYCKQGTPYYGFMYTNCKKTCGFCEQGKLLPPPPLPPLLSCGRNKGIKEFGRIVGGVDSYPNQWIWQGAIYKKGEFISGGSLIRNDILLTAAHSVFLRTAKELMVRMGDHKRYDDDNTEQDRRVQIIVVHPKFDRFTGANDIAILKLADNFILNKNVGTVCLPKQGARLPNNAKEDCYITGWGKTAYNNLKANILQQARLPVVPMFVCGLKNNDPNDGKKITDTMICGGFKNIENKVSGCHGDSGSPYVCKEKKRNKGSWYLQGVVSWGSRKCDASKQFTVSTRVSSYIKWIKDTMASN